MAVGLIANAASILATIVFTEGIFAYLEAKEGDPEADTAKLLENIQIQNQLAARTSLAAEQQGEERIQEQFAGFNRLGSQALSAATLASSPRQVGHALRQGQEVKAGQSDLLELVAAKMGITPEQFAKRTHPGRMGDMTGLMRAVGKNPGQ